MSQVSPLLLQNLAAIRSVDASLADRICLPVSGDHIQITDSAAYYLIQQGAYRLSIPVNEVAPAISLPEDTPIALLFGLGMGEQLDYLLYKYPNTRLLAWERDPWILRLVLSCGDYTEAIVSGRLRFLLGADLFDHLSSRPEAVVWHPLLRRLYPNEASLLDGKGDRKRALLCAGTLVVDDVGWSLRELGYDVYTWDVARVSREELEYGAKLIHPQVVFSVNYTKDLVETCRELNLKLAVWEIDPALDRLRPCVGSSAGAHIFTYRASNAAAWKQASYTNARYLPLAANTSLRTPVKLAWGEEKYVSKLSLVGGSMVENAALQRKRFLGIVREWRAFSTNDEATLDAVLAEQRADWSEYRIPALLDKYFPGLIGASYAFAHWGDPAMLVGELAASEWRLRVAASLGPLGLQVWGDEGWQQAAGVDYKGFAGHILELNKIYSNGLIHVDVSRLYQRDMVTMRVFDVLSCGGFVLTEHSSALGELFEVGKELDSWRTLEELKDKCTYYLAHPEEAQKIAAAGQAKVRAQHTILGRVKEMLAETLA